MSDFFARCHDYDPAEMNTLAELVAAGIEDKDGRFCTLTERYGTAVAIIESDWLRSVKSAVWAECEEALMDFVVDPFGDRIRNPY